MIRHAVQKFISPDCDCGRGFCFCERDNDAKKIAALSRQNTTSEKLFDKILSNKT